eukprot:6214627-Pleurochrysis_carterae.AAC.2
MPVTSAADAQSTEHDAAPAPRSSAYTMPTERPPRTRTSPHSACATDSTPAVQNKDRDSSECNAPMLAVLDSVLDTDRVESHTADPDMRISPAITRLPTDACASTPSPTDMCVARPSSKRPSWLHTTEADTVVDPKSETRIASAYALCTLSSCVSVRCVTASVLDEMLWPCRSVETRCGTHADRTRHDCASTTRASTSADLTACASISIACIPDTDIVPATTVPASSAAALETPSMKHDATEICGVSKRIVYSEATDNVAMHDSGIETHGAAGSKTMRDTLRVLECTASVCTLAAVSVVRLVPASTSIFRTRSELTDSASTMAEATDRVLNSTSALSANTDLSKESLLTWSDEALMRVVSMQSV